MNRGWLEMQARKLLLHLNLISTAIQFPAESQWTAAFPPSCLRTAAPQPTRATLSNPPLDAQSPLLIGSPLLPAVESLGVKSKKEKRKENGEVAEAQQLLFLAHPWVSVALRCLALGQSRDCWAKSHTNPFYSDGYSLRGEREQLWQKQRVTWTQNKCLNFN